VTFTHSVSAQSYVAIGQLGSAWLSTNGARWTPVPILAPGVSDSLGTIAINDSIVAVGGGSPAGPRFWLGNLVLMRGG
jgi:hypothetical protein